MSIKVLVIDDSALVRQVLSNLLSSDRELDVMRPASDPVVAQERMRDEWPDVVVLDIEMPRMDGITFLRKLMAEHPTPVVICSSLTERGARISIDALAAGAVSIIEKPKMEVKNFLLASATELIYAVKTAARANLSRLNTKPVQLPASPVPKHTADAILAQPALRTLPPRTETLIAIGTSTGGTLALEEILTALPPTVPGLLIVQHMPQNFTGPFARRLNTLCQIEVKEAEHLDPVLPGRALIAPGGKHLLARHDGLQYIVEVIDGPPVNRHRPSVDVLFRSVARCAGSNAMGILMTGMGDDGAAGLLEMRLAGARTIAQDEATSVVYGMPKEAVKRGAAAKILPLDAIAREIILQNGG